MLRVLCVEHCMMPKWSTPLSPFWDISAESIEELENQLRECHVGINVVLESDIFTWHPFETDLTRNPRRHVMALEPFDGMDPTLPCLIDREEAWLQLERGLPVILEARCWLTTVVPMCALSY